jgi:hypothetical protein
MAEGKVAARLGADEKDAISVLLIAWDDLKKTIIVNRPGLIKVPRHSRKPSPMLSRFHAAQL